MTTSSKRTAYHAFILLYKLYKTFIIITKMFINAITSEILSVSVVKGFHANFDDKIHSVTEAFISVLYRLSTVVILLLFIKVTRISQ